MPEPRGGILKVASPPLQYFLSTLYQPLNINTDGKKKAYLKNPTNPDSAAESSGASSAAPGNTSSSTPVVGDPSLAPAPILSQANLGIQPTSTNVGGGATGPGAAGAGAGAGAGLGNLPSGFLEPNYEVFDPLNWLLDGLVDLPYSSYSTVSGMETQGIA